MAVLAAEVECCRTDAGLVAVQKETLEVDPWTDSLAGCALKLLSETVYLEWARPGL